MDELKQCMDVLRALASQSTNPNYYLPAEKVIAEYLQSPGASREKLIDAIDHEPASSRQYGMFWTTMQEFISRGPDHP
jgi:hypothetical protein